MATVRSGNVPTLVIVDAQVGVLRGSWDRDRVAQNLARLVADARNNGTPVVWVQHADDELIAGSNDWEWVPELRPEPGEVNVPKRFNSSFEETDLQDVLEELGTTRIFLAGAATNWCIRATAYAALERGYDLTLIADAHTTEDLVFSEEKRVEAKDVIDDLNVTIQWLTYPGRDSASVNVEKLDFRA